MTLTFNIVRMAIRKQNVLMSLRIKLILTKIHYRRVQILVKTIAKKVILRAMQI